MQMLCNKICVCHSCHDRLFWTAVEHSHHYLVEHPADRLHPLSHVVSSTYKLDCLPEELETLTLISQHSVSLLQSQGDVLWFRWSIVINDMLSLTVVPMLVNNYSLSWDAMQVVCWADWWVEWYKCCIRMRFDSVFLLFGWWLKQFYSYITCKQLQFL